MAKRSRKKTTSKGSKGGPSNKGKTFPAEPLTKEEVLRLMDVCSNRAPTGVRDKALICVLWRAQLRVSEALALKVADFDPAQCTLRVLRGKGQKARIAVLDRQAAAELGKWLARREVLGFNGHQRIFCTLKGGPLSTAQVREMLPRRAKKAQIIKRVHAHGLRHTGASELVEEGVPLKEIQDQLGHSSAATTDRYLHAINPKARADRLRERTW